MAHSLTKLLVHCVFSTKDRRALLRGRISEKVNAHMAGIARNHGAHLIRAGGTEDHRHLLLDLRPATSVAEIVRFIKANSSKWLHETYPGTSGHGWQTGYAAFTVSESGRAKVIEYINSQEDHHRKMTFEQELAALLDRHGVGYDLDAIFE